MKYSLNWLKEYIDIDCNMDALESKLALAGFETEKLSSICEKFSGVIASTIKSKSIVKGHSDLVHYQLSINDDELVNVVSSTQNLLINTPVAFAPLGTKLKNFIVQPTDEYDFSIDGIICSECDLGISENHALLILDNSIADGSDIYEILDVEDQVLEVDITPNRGDCLSIKGMARELGAVLDRGLTTNDLVKPVIQHHSDQYDCKVIESAACPNFNTTIIYDLDNTVIVPFQIKERLRKSGVRSVNPVVDILNYVMLENGQPMHAYDMEKLSGELIVRYAKENEKLKLLNEEDVELTDDTLVIADDTGAIGLAGIMGGMSTSVDSNTRSIVLESACFNSELIIGKARKYGLVTESSFRFERGVSPLLQTEGLNRVVSLITKICQGQAGSMVEISSAKNLPQPKLIKFRQSRCSQILGIEIPLEIIRGIFMRLGFTIMDNSGDLDVRVPSYRFDINLEIDLIEEVARLYGYDNIVDTPTPRIPTRSNIAFNYGIKSLIRNLMTSYSYNEAITYSFVDPDIQKKLFCNQEALNLLNPISPQLSQMRISILPGLLQALVYNQHRQGTRVRLFEIGQCFITDSTSKLNQISKVAGAAYGGVLPEQWGSLARQIDFYDIKNDLEKLLFNFDELDQFVFSPADKSFLHPGQSAVILYKDQEIGYIGMLHPSVGSDIGLKNEVFIFELEIEKFSKPLPTQYKNLSIYPELRRDISFFVKKEVLSQEIINEIKQIPCSFLRKVSIFDIYEDKNKPSAKSMAIGLLLRDSNRTLVDEEVETFLAEVIEKLQKRFNIELRKE